MKPRIDNGLTAQDLGILALVFGFSDVSEFEQFANRQERQAETHRQARKVRELSQRKTRLQNGISINGLPVESRIEASKIKGKAHYV